MPNLKSLKTRLEKLPQVEKELTLAASFRHYTGKVSNSRKRLESAKRDMENITNVFPNSECQKAVSPLFNSSVKIVKTLRKEIETDPWFIEKTVAESKFVKLNEDANSAISKCKLIWNQEISGRITNWEKIAGVIKQLDVKGGQAFKQAFDKLKSWENKIPQNDNEVEQIKEALNSLQKGIANIGLEGGFGKFLKEAAEGGASPKDLLNDDIKDKFNEYNLWGSFWVQLKQ